MSKEVEELEYDEEAGGDELSILVNITEWL